MRTIKYQHLLKTDSPFVVCLVPADWLTNNLPTMGGAVFYVDSRESVQVHADCIFEFSRVENDDPTIHSIYLDVRRANANQLGYTQVLAQPIEIRCHNQSEADSNQYGRAVVHLLNHFFGSQALSATLNNIYLDIEDVIELLKISQQYDFAYAVGSEPKNIIPNIRNQINNTQPKCIFAMLYCDEKRMQMQYLDDMHDELSDSDSYYLASDVAIESDQMLISVLSGER
jgi:hypothetical protein